MSSPLFKTGAAKIMQPASRANASARGAVRNSLIGLFCICVLAAVAIVFFYTHREKPQIRIAAKPMTEQLILSEMLSALISQETGLAAIIHPNIAGGTETIHPALVSGKYDLYPEYTGTSWTFILKMKSRPDDSALYAQLCKLYDEKFGLVWTGLYGFKNSFGVGVRKEVASAYSLKNYSDMAAMAGSLRFGAEPDFYRREDGFQALAGAYGLKFGITRQVHISDKYQEIISGNIDVMNVFTTDGHLGAGNVTVLEDDLGIYPSYYCGTVVRRDVLEKYPALLPALKKLDGQISDTDMTRLNYQVEFMARQPREVALEFLNQKGLLAKK